jgi:hypothetical protein
MSSIPNHFLFSRQHLLERVAPTTGASKSAPEGQTCQGRRRQLTPQPFSLSFFLSSQIKLKSIVNRSTLLIFIQIEEIQSQNE